MEDEIQMDQVDFHDKLLKMLFAELLDLKFQVALLKGESADERAKMAAAYTQRFLGLFPEEAQPSINAQLDELIEARSRDGAE